MKLAVAAALLVAGIAAGQTVDRTGQTYPAGDGCNTSTCMDAACTVSSSTLVGCIRADRTYAPLEVAPSYFSIVVSDTKGLIASCPASGSSVDSPPENCQLAEGRTLTELMRVWVTSNKSDRDDIRQIQDDHDERVKRLESRYDAVIAAQKRVIALQKKEIAILLNGLKQIQKDLRR